MIIFLNIFIIVCMFIMGSLFGSFFSLAIYRLPRKQDIISTRSYCTSCKHRLEFFDLIPVFSYIFRMGKCKYCGDKISPRYLLLELSNGAIFVLMYLLLGYTFNLLVAVIIYAVVFVLIGSYIMDKKMDESERAQVKKEKELKKANNKKGVFVTELVIAMILFTVLLVSGYLINRNYQDKAIITMAKSNAVMLATNSAEMALATDYDKLESSSNNYTVSNTQFKVDSNVYKYSDEELLKKDIVKKIEVKVSYMVNGKPYEFMLRTLKGRVV